MELFHLAERAAWEAAEPSGRYERSTRGRSLADEGFIHCSLRHQVGDVHAAFYADLPADELVLLVIDGDRVGAPVKLERAVPGGDGFPHIYGPLPIAAVTARLPVERDRDGRLVLPE